MGQILDFNSNNNNAKNNTTREIDLVKLLPKLQNLKKENIVIHITDEVANNDKLLLKLLREVVILKYIEVTVVLILDTNKFIEDFCVKNLKIKKPFEKQSFVKITEEIDVFDMIFKHKVADRVSSFLKNFNATPLCISGHNLDIIFPDEIVYDKLSFFDFQKKDVRNYITEKKNKKYSIVTLEELLKTNIIPVIYPSFKDRIGNTYIQESACFGSYLSSCMSSLKYVEICANKKSIPTNCIYGIDRLSKIIKTGYFSKNDIVLMEACINAIKKGTQGAHIIDIQNVSLLEEFCSQAFKGLFIYDDILNQI